MKSGEKYGFERGFARLQASKGFVNVFWCKQVVRPYSFINSTCRHISPKAQVAANKNAHNFWLHFPAQFFMLFHMVWSILFRVLALKTLKWKFLIGCWRISTNEKVVSEANTLNKMDHAKWKNIRNCARKWCRKLCAFLLEVTWAFGKMCRDIHM